MGKKIIIATMLVLTLLLLMPSIPAIQQKTMEEGFKQDLQEKLEAINIDDIKHPLLYDLVMLYVIFRSNRLNRMVDFILEWTDEGFDYLLSIYWFRMMLIFLNVAICIEFWNNISGILGWGWDIPYPFPDPRP